MGDGEQLLTVQDVAARLRVGVETVRRWLRSGELPGVLLGDRAGWRVSASDLQAFLDGRRSGHGAVTSASVDRRRAAS
jgi:excisionase family DNA binding protein